jgi:hypothetical protein
MRGTDGEMGDGLKVGRVGIQGESQMGRELFL